ncbi:MAG TPA: methyltransferase domain-containing protein [Bryobacteraceae bacterium]|jgi:SAM-dependent methyltransferase|nr:methyltransferase domain-containing protein [Bryobacteraceae bacterium]
MLKPALPPTRATVCRLIVLLALGLATSGFCQIPGGKAYQAFLAWRNEPENAGLAWDAAIEKYRAKLTADGVSESEAAQIIRIITARDEGAFYDGIYTKPPKFQTAPSELLVEAVKNRIPGKALDVGMGQGRNSIYLASQGWDVTGFDVSSAGLAEARRLAASAGVYIKTVLASDEEFDFGGNRWDLIAILYPLEKRSVYRVRKALKPGGIVVVECSHKDPGNASFGFEMNELPRIFDGFRILKYEDATGVHEWSRKEVRLVRLIAQK